VIKYAAIEITRISMKLKVGQKAPNFSFPLLSDFSPQASVAKKYGVRRKEGFSERAIFVLDKYGIIRHIDIHDIKDRPKNKILFAEFKKVIQLESELEKVAAKGRGKAMPKGKAKKKTGK
jgi:alkyl hydroperoxide reductase subunit AhpC